MLIFNTFQQKKPSGAKQEHYTPYAQVNPKVEALWNEQHHLHPYLLDVLFPTVYGTRSGLEGELA